MLLMNTNTNLCFIKDTAYTYTAVQMFHNMLLKNLHENVKKHITF